MRARLWLAVVTVFWLAMSVWLWRSSFGAHTRPGNVPPAVVWQKILTAPDTSHLEIHYKTNVIGYCRWRPDVGQELATGARLTEDDPLEGMVQQLAYYSLDLDGNVTLPDFPTRLRFSLSLKLDTNHLWQTFDAHFSMRPDTYELSADSAAQMVRLRVDAAGEQLDRRFRFNEFQDPAKLLREFGGPMLPTMAMALGVPLSTNKAGVAWLAGHWEARNDSMFLGPNRVRVYRLQTKLLDRYKVTLFVSPVGELLRAELPGEVVLVHDTLANLRT